MCVFDKQGPPRACFLPRCWNAESFKSTNSHVDWGSFSGARVHVCVSGRGGGGWLFNNEKLPYALPQGGLDT